MNQILENKKDKLKNKKRYYAQFYISFFVIICIIIYFSYKKYTGNNFSKVSDATNKSYNITRLYSNVINSNYTTNETQISIIGTIKIPKLEISYPIFSEYSDELLKISVCKFYGPEINTTGNLCIIGHNYNNGDFFSDLYKLNINDIIDIYDINSKPISYYVYSIYEVNANDLNYLNQNTNGKREITLITCNNSNRKTYNF